jgi:hypothetical protein
LIVSSSPQIKEKLPAPSLPTAPSSSLLTNPSSPLLTAVKTQHVLFIGNPYNDPNIRGDAYRTLFISNLVNNSISFEN